MYIDGNDKDNLLEGGAQDDTIIGRGGRDTLRGMAGDDSLYGGVGDDSILGGEGKDVIYDYDGDNFADGGAGDDTIEVGGQSTVRGGAGDDKIYALSGLLQLSGNDGADQLYVNSYYESVIATLNGGDGEDLLQVDLDEYSDSSEVVLDGGDGIDTFRLGLSGQTFDLDLRGLANGPVVLAELGLTLQNLERGYLGFDGGDVKVNIGNAAIEVHADYGDDLLIAGKAGTLFDGGYGFDTIRAGGGADTLIGGYGDDVLNGGKGRDLALFDSESSVQVDLRIKDVQFTGQGFDILIGIEDVSGGGDRDRLIGDDGGNRLQDDMYEWGDYADTLMGGGGADTLTAHAGEGVDMLTGGEGLDRFVFIHDQYNSDSGVEIIADLAADELIDISALDADIYASGDQKFLLVSELSGARGEAALVYDAKADKTLLLLETGGWNDEPDYTIELLDGDWTGFTGFKL
ncbi:MAG TPA: calcium-binding protein [Caulobacteraceae bacterium]|jgi:Ca2+-binding RTX toxin-like protein